MSRRSRRVLVVTIFASLVASAAALWLLRPRPPVSAISWDNVRKVDKGMSREEVEALLGGPPRDEVEGARWAVWMKRQHPGPEFIQWVGPQAAVAVEFDDRGRVLHSDVAVVAPPSRSVYDILRGRW